MHPAALLVALLSAGGLFTALPASVRGGPLLGTLVPMVVAITFAVAVSGRPNALSVIAGAALALFGSLAWAWLPPVAGAVALSFAFAERSLRVRPVRARILHVGLAAVAGAAAGALADNYLNAPPLYRGVALVMCSVLALVPLFVEADEPRVLLLEQAARRLGATGSPVAPTLLEGVELLRCDIGLLDRETAANVQKSWGSLEKLVEARLALLGKPTRRGETAAMVAAVVDRQITEHVKSLTRAYAAVTTIGAAEAGIDDTALRDVHARGEALDQQSRAIIEVGRG
jgi:hypothetical protein